MTIFKVVKQNLPNMESIDRLGEVLLVGSENTNEELDHSQYFKNKEELHRYYMPNQRTGQGWVGYPYSNFIYLEV